MGEHLVRQLLGQWCSQTEDMPQLNCFLPPYGNRVNQTKRSGIDRGEESTVWSSMTTPVLWHASKTLFYLNKTHTLCGAGRIKPSSENCWIKLTLAEVALHGHCYLHSSVQSVTWWFLLPPSPSPIKQLKTLLRWSWRSLDGLKWPIL